MRTTTLLAATLALVLAAALGASASCDVYASAYGTGATASDVVELEVDCGRTVSYSIASLEASIADGEWMLQVRGLPSLPVTYVPTFLRKDGGDPAAAIFFLGVPSDARNGLGTDADAILFYRGPTVVSNVGGPALVPFEADVTVLNTQRPVVRSTFRNGTDVFMWFSEPNLLLAAGGADDVSPAVTYDNVETDQTEAISAFPDAVIKDDSLLHLQLDNAPVLGSPEFLADGVIVNGISPDGGTARAMTTATVVLDDMVSDGEAEAVRFWTHGGDGTTSEVTLLFSTPLDAASVGSLTTSMFTLRFGADVYTPTSIANSASEAAGGVVRLMFATINESKPATSLTFMNPNNVLRDVAGFFVTGSASLSGNRVHDSVRPNLVSATATAGSSMVTLEFTEPVRLPAENIVSLKRANDSVVISSVGVTPSGNNLLVDLGTVLESYRGDDYLVSLTPGSGLHDLSGNRIETIVQDYSVANSDTTAPSIASVATADSNNDGSVDQIVVTFSEAVDGSTAIGEWTVDGFTVTAAEHSGEVVTLTLDVDVADPPINTDAVPAVTYSGTGLVDLAFLPVTGGVPATTDGVGPVLLKVEGAHSDTTVTATFSETVASPFQGTLDFGGVPATADTVDGATVTITLDAALTTDDFLDPATVLTATSAADAANGATRTSSASLVPTDAAAVAATKSTIETADTASAGVVDQIRVTFDRAVAMLGDVGGFVVADHTVNSVAVDDANKAVVLLGVTADDAEAGTDSTPEVSFAGSVNLTNLVGTDANSFTAEAAADKAPPVPLAVAGSAGDPAVTITFSEPVTFEVPAVDAGSTTVSGTGGGPASSASWALTFDPAPALDQFESPIVGTLLTVDVFSAFGKDGNNNPVVETTNIPLTFADKEPPTINGAVALDGTGDGLVNLVRVDLSEELYTGDVDSLQSLAPWTVSLDGKDFAVERVERAGSSLELFVATEADVPGNTDLTPLVAYNASAGTVRDASLNPLASVEVASTDGAKPVIWAAESEVGVNKVVVTLSEPYKAATVGDAASAVVLGGPLGGFAITAAAGTSDPRVLELTLDGPLQLDNFTDSTLALAARITDLTDLAASTDPKPLTNRDLEPPTLVAAATLDMDGNGIVDAIQMEFNEPMADNGAAGDQFTVVGRRAAGFPISATGNVVVARIAEGDSPDTGVTTLKFGYTPGSVTDVNGRQLGAFSDQDLLDGASPVLVGASAQLLATTMDLEFSEPVANTTVADFAWLDATGLPAITGASVAGGGFGATVVLTFDGPLPAAVFDGTDKIGVLEAVRGSDMSDAAGNLPRASSVSVVQVNPVVVSAATVDVANEGKVSAIRLVFDRDMGDGDMSTAGFSVSAGGLAASGDTFTRVSGTEFELDVTGGDGRGTALGDDVAVSVSYDASAGSVTSASNAELLSFDNLAVADGAGPVLLSVAMDVGDSRVYATFSEPVFDAQSGTETAVDPAVAFAYETVSGAPALLSTFVGGQDGTADGTMVVNTGSDFAFEDRDKVIRVVAGQVRDRVENEAFSGDGNGKALAFQDTAAPSLNSAEARDSNGDGVVDRIVVAFSEPLLAESVQAGDFALGGADAAPSVTIEGADLSDGTVTLTVAGLGANTGVNLTVALVSGVSDLNRNALEGTDPEPCADLAAPVVLRVTGTVDEDRVTVYLSEPVGSEFAAANFSVDAGAAARPAFAVVEVADGDASRDGTVVLRLNRTLVLADLDQEEPSNLIVLAAGVAVDANGNPNADGQESEVLNAVSTASGLESAETLDVDGDGRLDHVRLVFGARVIDSSFEPAQHVEVEGFVVDGLADAAAGLTDVANDREVVVAISLQASRALSVNQGNTGLTPQVTLTPGASSPSDVHGLTFVAGSVTAADKAEPVIVSAYGGLGSDQVVVHLSEAVPSSLLRSSFRYVDSNAGEDGSVSRILRTDQIDGLRVPITVAGTFVASDLGAAGDRIGLAPDVVQDSNGNIVTAVRTRPLVSSDALESTASSSADTVALAVGGSAAFLGIMLLVVLFVIKKKKSTGDKGSLEMHVNENITTEGSMEQYAAPNTTGGDEEVGGGMAASSSTDNLVTREPDDAEEVVVEVSAAQRPSTPPGDPPSDAEE